MFVPRSISLIDFTQYSHSTYLLDIMHKAFSGVNYIPLVERSVMFRELIPVCQSDRWGGGGVKRCFTRTVTGVILTWPLPRFVTRTLEKWYGGQPFRLWLKTKIGELPDMWLKHWLQHSPGYHGNMYHRESLVSFLRKYDVIKIGLKQKGNIFQPTMLQRSVCMIFDPR